MDDAALQDALTRTRESVVRAARHDANVFAGLVLTDEKTGRRVKQAAIHRRMHAAMDASDRLVMWGHVESGKALPLTTEIPTPSGWRPMGDLIAGDTVFGGDGYPCTVQRAYAVQYDRPVYDIELDDGAVIRADADHQWSAWRYTDRRDEPAPRVVSTAEMAARVRRSTSAGSGAVWFLPLAGPVQYPAADLPVHPYVLGAWLGAGHAHAPVITCHEADRFVLDRCRELEGGDCPVHRDRRAPHILFGTVGGSLDRRRNRDPSLLRARLRALGVLRDKHIPAAYLRASVAQRRELLAGLLDTDGSVSNGAGGCSRIELSLRNERLALDAVELIRSLGFKARIRSGPAKLRGRTVGTRHRITFTAREPVFHLPRKRGRQRLGWGSSRARRRAVVEIRPVESEPVRCISVDSHGSTFLAGRAYTVTHNTYQIAARIVHDLGCDPSLRIGVCGSTFAQAQKTLSFVRVLIETRPEVREVFPHLRPGNPWRENAISVGRPTFARDPSVIAFGTGAKGVLGSRLDRVYADDIVDLGSSSNQHNRDALESWVLNTLFGRLTPNARVVLVGNAYHPADLMHMLAKLDGWRGIRFPVLDAHGRPTWPERWPLDRIEKKRREVGPLEFARSMMCLPRSDEDSRFHTTDIDACKELGRGLGAHLPTSLQAWRPAWTEERKRRCRFYTGVDLAIQTHAKADVSAIFTIAVHPNKMREIVGLEAGRWKAHDIIARVGAAHRRWGSVTTVENVAAQEWMRQFIVEMEGVPALPFTTGKGKASLQFQAETLAAEIAAHRWIIPCDEAGQVHPQIAEWITALMFYNPSAHTPDRLAASLFARDRAGREESDGDGAWNPADTIISIPATGDGPLWGGGGHGGGGGGGCWG